MAETGGLSTSREIAERAIEIYDAQVRSLVRELILKMQAAKAQAKALSSEVGDYSWEYAWLGEASWNFGVNDLDEEGINVEYFLGENYPADGFVPYAFLDDPAPKLAQIRAEILEERAQRKQRWVESERARLTRQLAELEGK